MLQKILGAITRPPVPFVLGTLLAIALVWFGGNLLQSGYGRPGTFVIVSLCVLILVLAIGFVVLRSLRARQKARAIENEIRNQAKAQAATLPPGNQGDIETLQARFDEALDSLKTSKLGRGALYAMPWFIIIGPPGSGKTTAITESGLNFPFMKGPNQKRGIRGLGGTRNCDWWFTDQSILLDTAGRYTTEAEDHDEWLAFLGMIKKARKLKPINGVLVALSITDVLNADEEGVERHATTIRQRIDELVKQLEVVFPIYLMFTKCDLLDGFVEFFSSMSKEERAQVWGVTFDQKHTSSDEMHDRFGAEFDLLCQRVDEERMRLLVPDRPAGQQQKIFSLSLQLRAAKRKVVEFVRLLTQPNPYSDASELRGVYLTSGTQEGAPIDLVLQKLSNAFGLQSKASTDPLGAVDQKSYFIRDLVTKVVYADRELAHSSAGVQRRRELGRKALIYGSAAAALVLGVTSVMTWSSTRSLLANLEHSQLGRVEIDARRADAPPEAAQQSLGRLRDHYLELQHAYSPTSLLGPSRAVVLTAMAAYARGVRTAFLEPLCRHLEEKLGQYKAGDNGLDFTANSQLVTIYGAMDGEYVPYDDALRTAIGQQSLWRWSPAEIGTAKNTVSTSEESKHLDAFLTARRFDTQTWVVGTDKSLLGSARQKLNSGKQTQNEITTLLQEDPSVLNAAESDVGKLMVKKLEEKSPGTKFELTPALEQQISAQRKTEVLSSTANIRLQDTTSLPKVLESLADLTRPQSTPLRTFTDNIEMLRQAGAAPRPGIGQDAVTATYAEALKDVANLRGSLDTLVRNGGPGRYVLPDVLASKPDTMAQFGKEWNAAQASIARKIDQIAELVKSVGEQASAPAVDAIHSSLSGIMNSIVEAIAREARGEMQQHWRDSVGTELMTYAERFPSHSNAAEDANVPAFVDLFRPGGKVEQELAILSRLRSIKELQPFLSLDHPFEDTVARVKAIQAACFDPAAPQTARLLFHIAKMNISDPVLNVVLTIAQGDVVSKQSGTTEKVRNVVRNWPIGKVGAQLLLETAVELPNNQKLKLSLPKDGNAASPWGFLRLLAAGDPKASGDAKVTWEALGADAKVTWEVPFQTNAGTTVIARAWILFEPEGVQNPLTPRFFLLEPAARIFQARDQ